LFSTTFVCALALYGRAQPAAQSHTQIQSHIPIQAQAIALVTVSCSANPVKVFTGGLATIRAQGTSLQGLPLTYAFTTNAGQLSTSGAISRLNTSGLGVGTVHVTCTATDTAGRSASQAVEIGVIGMQHTEELHLPAHPTVAPIIVQPPAPKQGEAAKLPETPPPPPPPVDPSTGPEPKPAPVQPEPATPAQGETAPAQPATPDVYNSSTEIETWVNQLKQGKIEYKVPQRMLLLQTVTVTAVIHGYQDVNTGTLTQPTGSAPLKQSPRMKVELLAEDDPDAFTIALQNGDAVKNVLSNQATTWIWKVTPNKSGAKQRLKIIASLMYPNADKAEIQLQDYHTTVEVDVASIWSTIVDNYQHDPLKFFSYMIPGGAGFTFIAGLIVWWWKRSHKDEKD
jgi:hypothetical protein